MGFSTVFRWIFPTVFSGGFFRRFFHSTFLQQRRKVENQKSLPKNSQINSQISTRIFFEELIQQKPFKDLNERQLIEILTKKIIKKTLQDFLLSKKDLTLNFFQTIYFGWLCSSVKNGMPLDLVIGSTSFLGQTFLVSRGVFLPRVETEELTQKIINHHSKEKKKLKILELGCGSGVIAISLLAHLNATVKAVDINSKAIKQTKLNAQKLLSKEKLKQLTLFKGNVFSKKFHDQIKKETFDIIATNPPYIAKTEKKIVDEQTKKYDPPRALYAGSDGFQFYEKIFPLLPFWLEENSVFYSEIGFSQGSKIVSLAKKLLPNHQTKDVGVKIRLRWNIFVNNDIFGKARFLTIRLKKEYF